MKCLLGQDLIEEAEARISPFDRGYLFADGIYEVIAVLDGKLLDAQKHWDRLERSCGEIGLKLPAAVGEMQNWIINLVEANGVSEGRVYFQITRGVAERDFSYDEDMQPQFFAFVREAKLLDTEASKIGIKAITFEDLRWKRRDIKSIALLPQTIAKQAAKKQGAGEAVMHEDGFITEGSSSTIYIIKGNKLITRDLSRKVLPGVTRISMLELAESAGLEMEFRAISLEEAFAADEMFMTSASAILHPIIQLDETKIGTGEVGFYSTSLRKAYLETALKQA